MIEEVKKENLIFNAIEFEKIDRNKFYIDYLLYSSTITDKNDKFDVLRLPIVRNLRENREIERGLIVDFLIKKGQNVSDKNELGETPLHKAILLKRTNTAEILISSGADIEAKDLLGKTPLIIAIETSNYKMIKLLIESGAKTDYITDKNTLKIITDALIQENEPLSEKE